jgi:hypothetical protein
MDLTKEQAVIHSANENCTPDDHTVQKGIGTTIVVAGSSPLLGM